MCFYKSTNRRVTSNEGNEYRHLTILRRYTFHMQQGTCKSLTLVIKIETKGELWKHAHKI